MKHLSVVLIALLPACSGALEEGELENEPAVAQANEALTTLGVTPNSDGIRYVLGVKEPFSNGTQAPATLDSTVMSLPRSRDFTLRFSGWSGSDLTQVQSNYSFAQSRMATALSYTYTQVASNAYIVVRNSTISGGLKEVPGSPGSTSVLSFMSASCRMGPPLSEGLTGAFAQHVNQNDACEVRVDTAKLNTFCAFDATCVKNVQRHIAAYSLAYVGGLGRSQISTGLFATQMNVDRTVAKTSVPNAQSCLGRGWSDTPGGQYVVSPAQCTSFPTGW
jgi:hypothetical protein